MVVFTAEVHKDSFLLEVGRYGLGILRLGAVGEIGLIPILRCWGRKPPAKKLTEVNGDAVEEEVSIASSIVDGDKALEVLVECFC